jgi:TRAP-type mannitol/chloroaromatic compound transport system permease small subunit
MFYIFIYAIFPIAVWAIHGWDVEELSRCKAGILVWYAPLILIISFVFISTDGVFLPNH